MLRMLELFIIGSIKKNVKEVEVQFQDEDPAWIPYDTYISMMSCKIPHDYTDYVD